MPETMPEPKRKPAPDRGQAGKPIPRFTVVAILKNDRERRTAAAVRKSPLTELITEGRAEEVFDSHRMPLSVAGQKFEVSPDLPRAFVIGLDSEKEVGSVLERVSSDPLVGDAYVSPPRDLYRTKSVRSQSSAAPVPPDEWWWNAVCRDAARNAPGYNDAKDVKVAVIDSGIDQKHPDLKDALDDFINFSGGPARDSSGHGTHISGIIAGRNQSANGVDGLSRARILALKALDPYWSTGYYRALAVALQRATVINLSLGGTAEDPLETNLIRRAVARGVVVVVAMGNEEEFSGNGDTVYPAALSEVIAVGAVDRHLRHAPFSSTGPHIHLVAPGVGIRSCAPTYKSSLCKSLTYAYLDGTSMAAPFVSGTVALLRAKHPNLDPQQVKAALKARFCDGQAAFDDRYGHGIIDVASTLV